MERQLSDENNRINLYTTRNIIVQTSSFTNKFVNCLLGVGSALQTMQFCSLFGSELVRPVDVIFQFQ